MPLASGFVDHGPAPADLGTGRAGAVTTACAVALAVSGTAGAGTAQVAEVPASASVPVLLEDHFLERIADSCGSVDVSVVDGEGFHAGSHGQRITEVFVANTNRASLVQIGGWGSYRLGDRELAGLNLNGIVRHGLERGGGIFWTSTDDSPLYSPRTARNWLQEKSRVFHRDARAAAEWLEGQDTLFISSLENPTVDRNGTPVHCDDFDSDGESWIPLCGALDDYIAHSGVGLEKTLFVGALDDQGLAAGAILATGVFAPHTIHVESPDGSTSQAVPVLAAYATNLAFSHPEWDAARLKKELMAIAVEEVVHYLTGATDRHGTVITERRIVRSIRPAFAPTGEPPGGRCTPDGETLCLHNARYRVRADWWNRNGRSCSARTVGENTDDSGLFRFFHRDNWEVLIKVLNGCTVNDHVWVFGASTTDLGYSITVTDTATGEFKEYRNEPGKPADAITDSEALSGGCAVGTAD